MGIEDQDVHNVITHPNSNARASSFGPRQIPSKASNLEPSPKSPRANFLKVVLFSLVDVVLVFTNNLHLQDWDGGTQGNPNQSHSRVECFCSFILLFDPNGAADSAMYVLVNTGVSNLLEAS